MKKEFKIPDMHCPACVIRLEEIEDDLPGVLSAAASYHKQTLAVEWDENLVDEAQILDAVKAKGYQITTP